MKTSLVLTVNNRPAAVSQAVADSFRLPGNEVDEVIVVLDRPTEEAKAGAEAAWDGYYAEVQFLLLDGEPGWKCPARAWNAGFKAATGDLLYCISSEVVQDAGNVTKALEVLKGYPKPAALFGACHNSEKVQLVNGAEPGLLVSSKMPRPLGFIVAMPRKNVLEVGGMDEAFMDGFWYDDDDFFYRLWKTGLDFIFDDSVHGVHLHHERSSLTSAGIEKNRQLMLRKHGRMDPLNGVPFLQWFEKGRTVWGHV
jgi:GT2 family glycosyltransferase